MDRTVRRISKEAERGVLQSRPGPQSESILRPGRHSLGLGRGRDGVVYVPQSCTGAEPAPLVLLLHGAGADGANIVPILSDEAEARGIVVLAPDSRSGSWDVIRGGYGPDIIFIDAALAQVFARYPIDPERTAIAGFSDGASYALSLGIINGLLFSDILAFSPGFMAPTLQEDAPRIFMCHGVEDRVLPIDRCSRPLERALSEAGYDLDYREFEGAHTVPVDMVRAAIERFTTSGK